MRIQRQDVRPRFRPPAIVPEADVAAFSRRLESVSASAPGHVIAAPWHDMLRACSAVEVFDFFHSAGLATHSYRHHCLAALRRESFLQFAHRVRPDPE
jgi:hypothetical protein